MPAATDRSGQLSPLREHRLSQSVGVREAARLAGMDPSHLVRIESGKTAPTVATLYRLAVALHIDGLEQALRPFVSDEERLPAAS